MHNLLKEKENLKELVNLFDKDFDEYKKKSSKFNEQMTRQQYIDEFLRLLGWDISNPSRLSFNEREVVAEEYSHGNKKDRPDYTIRMNGISKFFVEAKKVSVDIFNDPAPAIQCRRYGWNSGHDISILTNFEYFIIYLTHEAPKEVDSASVYRYKVFHYKDYVDSFEEIYSLISRESVVNGDFKKWTEIERPEDYSRTSLDSVFLNQLNTWRVSIANDILTKDPDVDLIYLNEQIQLFLNQVIFLRFAEDNRFEGSESLKDEILKHDSYINYFKDLDNKYNSDLFKDSTIINEISDNLLKEIVEDLYFPKTSYDFSVIDLAILSKIYENFLQQEIIIENGKAKLEKTKSAKLKAVVSTPDEIVVAMVHNVLDKYIRGKKPEEIAELKICDLAVGSGIFLIEAYNYIENYLVDYYSKVKNQYPSKELVPFSVKRHIIENVLWGFDINSQAVKLTRFSLLLRLLSNEKAESVENISPILPNLKNTIINANSLVSDEDIDLTTTPLDSLYEIVPLDIENIKNQKFDIILGNPPYLKKEDILNSTPEIETNLYNDIYLSAYKQYDKYFLFIEKAVNLLDKSGTAILLVPNKMFIVGAGKKLRKLLYDESIVYKIYDFGVSQLFNGVINYVCILHLSNNDGEFEYTSVSNADEVFNKKTGIKYSNEDLNNNHWFLTSDIELKNKFTLAMNEFPCIEEEIIPANGIQTSKNTVYEIDKSKITKSDDKTITFTYEKQEFSIEKAILKDLYKPTINKGVKKSYENIVANKYVIFPYTNGKIIEENVLMSDYPLAYEYLLYNKDKLLPSVFGGKRDVKGCAPKDIKWYQYGRTQGLNVGLKDKLIVGVLSKNPIFNIDREGMLYASGGTAGYIGLFLKDNSKYTLEFMQAWLSHYFTDQIFKTIGSDFEGGYYTHGTNTYKSIPLLPIDFDDKIELYKFDKINELVKKINELNVKISKEKNKNKLNILKRTKDQSIKKIDEFLDDLLEMKLEKSSE
ncbi:Eco57I restriction-modification methylase domain-containing protein [Finegoldia magna]|uniref:Eco57I restriction-modification methylase domain-containing protein n=1 Tax=Finegoldia magna TaxID=1260 RepID=UPI000B916585|nr:Eco57I restriction-modification methylase domain-containing protein [Finegoldia magna]OXZ40161.1 restriction endonuclease [Finegoldia magna]